LDIAPRFAGIIIGISNVFGSMPGFISPMLVGYITVNNTPGEWQLVFWITAVVYAIGVVFFALTVSGDKQYWNDDPTGQGWQSSDKRSTPPSDKKPQPENNVNTPKSEYSPIVNEGGKKKE